jgi:hypothetical protein
VSIEVLSSEELQHIVHNARYREVLSDLLKPSVDRRDELISGAESGDSADHTVTDDQSERGADHTRSLRIHRLQPATRQKRAVRPGYHVYWDVSTFVVFADQATTCHTDSTCNAKAHVYNLSIAATLLLILCIMLSSIPRTLDTYI